MESPGKKKVPRQSLYSLRRGGALYKYSPIDKEASEIRLMTLLPGAFGTKIQVTLRNEVLSNSLVPEYEALSYAWGSVAIPDYIYIQETDGESALAITQDLAEALQYLRYENRSRLLWIDSICVDQSNIGERGHQVLRMADIYRRASRVVIWLGPERDDSTKAMQVLDTLGSTVEVDWSLKQVKPLSGDTYLQWLEEPIPFANDRRITGPIECFLDRPWFKRLWIWQEVQLANNGALIICGGKSMLWDTFRKAVVCLHRKLPPSTQLNQAMNICDYSRLGQSLSTLLHHTRHAQCSDERDKVYAIFNLSYDFLELEPDYSETTEDVFKGVILHYALRLKDLTVLRHCEMRANNETRVPSWVPDWTIPKKCDMIFSPRASLGTEVLARYEEQNVLVVSGCLVATLDAIEQFPPISPFLYSTVQMRSIIGNLLQGKRDSYVAGGLRINAVCRTLLCNRFAESFLPLATQLPSIQESKEHVRNLIDHRELIEPAAYLDGVMDIATGRAYFQTRSGHIGLGPSSIKAGDQACVILGCHALLILRPNAQEGYMVVGECYIDGFMDGEALLGALPSSWQRIARYFPDLGFSWHAFRNLQTGDIQVDDPRLGPLPAGWYIVDHGEKHAYNLFSNEEAGVTTTDIDPRLSPEALKARGVNLQEIRLV